MRLAVPALLSAFLGVSIAQAEERRSGVVLVERTGELGIDFVHENGGSGEKHLPETMGAGAAWLDFDGDGWLDLYLVQSGRYPPDGGPGAGNRLYRNLDGAGFLDVTDGSGAGDRGYGQGTVAADVDGDGDLDLYVANEGADVLLRNGGDGTFEDATEASGLGVGGWSSSAAFADADGDSDLDLYVARYVVYDRDESLFCGDAETGERRYCDPNLFRGMPDVYYENLGKGRFAEASERAGIAPADGRGLGVVFTDLDGDTRPDIYVANDISVNLLFRNLGGGRFEDISLLSGAGVNEQGKPEGSMGIAVTDADEDGDPDLAVTNFDVETNTLYVNVGAAGFEDRSVASGFGIPSFNLVGFGIVSTDLNRDGHMDYFVANGHIFERPPRDTTSHAQRPLVLMGDGTGTFRTLRCPEIWDRPVVARALAAGDYDNDGDADLALTTNDGPSVLLENRPASGHWLGARLVGRSPNTGAVGSEVRLTWSGGVQRRWVMAGDSYQSASDSRPLFALPDDGQVKHLDVRWPGGARTRFVDPPLDRYLILHQP